MKYDEDKPRYDLLPPIAINELAKVLTFGAEKYEAESWRTLENGERRYTAALLRHTFAMLGGELYDPESGLLHSSHIMTDAAFIVEFQSKRLTP